jgi:hypothetical protein
MARILLLGLDPETVDFSDPALPPGMTAEKVRAGITVALKRFTERGWESAVGFIRPDETAGPTVERQCLGAELLRRLIDIARREEVERITADIYL